MIQFLKISFIYFIIISIHAFNYTLTSKDSNELAWSFKAIHSDKSISYNEKKVFIPASTLKVVSMLFALDTLGADYTFKTKLYYTGKISKGILDGDLYIVGGSDPYLNHPQLINLAKSVQKLGIKKVNGFLNYDTSLYKEHKTISSIGLGDQTYNPSFGPLNSEFNRHSLWINSQKQYQSIIPELEIKLTKSNQLLPTQKFKWEESTDSESWKINPNEKLSRREDLPIRNAALWTTKMLSFHLSSYGITIKGIRNKLLPKESNLIFSNKSLPLWNLISLTMEYSNNLFAESIAMTACQKKGSQFRDQQSCAKEIQKYFLKYSKSQSNIVNASGLSVDNKLTADAMSEFLKNKGSKDWQGHSLESFLSISGQSGWMRDRLESPEYNLRVFAKTGSLDFINNIVGLVKVKSGAWYSFSIFHMDEKKRNLLDLLPKKKLKRLENEAKTWRRSSLGKLDSILAEFINQH
ncbi:D-alanyl-D-alanine carboxypeptidase/D-alanyl-D-alanine-endopeptidase [Halobacteriovorax sp. HLS]|uniref:D-alanyl-D-alanine carboxypeptidase/D-alanyl-D-alanine endopeptidase n=1 Tax=Halobacteriovorax sp. HLS TaxID=2234000 RepID=UPI000FD7C556|nr:D-alanyl-D-alanine carboxypeptidase/D-alanyl-D-alanine-endopeptidase [Halobacteriovorax sp. HLS]